MPQLHAIKGQKVLKRQAQTLIAGYFTVGRELFGTVG